MANALLLAPLPIATITADSSLNASFAPEYLMNEYMGVRWASANLANSWLQVDLGTSPAVDTISFLATSQLGTAETVRIRAAATAANTTTSARLIDITQPIAGLYDFARVSPNNSYPNDSTFNLNLNSLHLIPLTTARFWRFDFATPTFIRFAAGRLVMGRRINLARNFTYGGLGRGVRDMASVEYTRGGGVLTTPGVKLRTLDMQWQSLSLAETESAILPLIEAAGGSGRLMICVDPDVNLYRSTRIYYGTLQAEQSVAIRAYDAYVWRAQLTSVV